MDLEKRLQDALGNTYFFDRELGAVGMSRAMLRVDPMFENLRKDPRFQKLIAQQ